MTVASETSKVRYNGDGDTTDFSVTFKYTAKSQIVVVHADSDGVETTWVLGTQYTLTDPGASGTLTVIDTPTDYTPASGETLTIYRDPDFTQVSDYTTGGGLTAEGIEADLDTRVFQIQRLREMLSRAVLFKQSTGESDLTLPELVAGKGLAVNDDGDALEWADIKEIFVQNSAPSTSEPSGSLWIDADSTDNDLYQLVSGVWTDTGVNLKGATGAGDPGADGVNAGLTYAFNTGTSGDPGSGQFLANNATLSSATAINISDTDGDANNVSAWLATWDDSDHSIRGTVVIRDQSDTAAFAVFNITGASSDESGYWTLAVTHIASAGTLSGNCSIQFYRSGDDGDGSGDVTGPASSTAGNLASFSDTSGKDLADSGIAAADVVVASDIANMLETTDIGFSVQAYDVQLDGWSAIDPATAAITFTNTGLHLLDTNASHDLIIAPGSDLSADRTLTLTTGDANRTLTLSGNAALNQNLRTTDSPTFANMTRTGYTDIAEISTPSDPAANNARLYAFDDSGTTKLAFRDSAGAETVLGEGGGGGSSWTYVTEVSASGNPVVLASGLDASGISEIEIMLRGISHTSDNNHVLIQIGDSGGVETAGYVSALSTIPASQNFNSATNGIILTNNADLDNADVYHGVVRMIKYNDDPSDWSFTVSGYYGTPDQISAGYGHKTLSGSLTTIQLVPSAGTIDAGTVSVRYR